MNSPAEMCPITSFDMSDRDLAWIFDLKNPVLRAQTITFALQFAQFDGLLYE